MDKQTINPYLEYKFCPWLDFYIHISTNLMWNARFWRDKTMKNTLIHTPKTKILVLTLLVCTNKSRFHKSKKKTGFYTTNEKTYLYNFGEQYDLHSNVPSLPPWYWKQSNVRDSYYKFQVQLNFYITISSMASKPNNIRWIKIGSKPH